MADMTWSALTADRGENGSIKRWVSDTSLDPEEIIAEAEDWLNKRVRVRLMRRRNTFLLPGGYSLVTLTSEEEEDDGGISSGDGSDTPASLVTLPVRFLDPINLRILGPITANLDLIAEEEFGERRPVDPITLLPFVGTPAYYAILNNNLYLDMKTDQDYTFELLYYGRPLALSETQTTSMYTKAYRSLFKDVCMARAYLFLKDEGRAKVLLASAEEAIQQINMSDDLSRRGEITNVWAA